MDRIGPLAASLNLPMNASKSLALAFAVGFVVSAMASMPAAESIVVVAMLIACAVGAFV